MRSHGLTILTGLAGVVLLVGCTSTNPGRAEPAPPTASTETTTTSTQPSVSGPTGRLLPSDGAPKVKNPLDVSRFQQDPCLALTAVQAQELNVPRGAPVEAPLGNACQWSNAETRGEVRLAFLDENPRGLSGLYAANKADELAFFNEVPEIEGFPAVAFDVSDDRKNGGCAVGVGVSDPLAFNVSLQLSRANVGQKDPCEVTVQVAGMMLRTMKAGG